MLEEIAARWAAVAVAVSVHSLSSHPLLTFGTDEQKQPLAARTCSAGELLGAYCLSEPQAGSDAAALRCAADDGDGGYVHQRLQGVDHPRRARRLLHAVRPHRRRLAAGISCFLVPGDLAGLSLRQARGEDGPARRPDHIGVLRPRPHRRRPAASAPRARACRSPSARWIPAGWASPRSPSGWRRPRWTRPSRYANERTTFGRKIIDHQGLGFLLADMAAAVGQRAGHVPATPRADATSAGRIRRRPASPSWSPPTPR